MASFEPRYGSTFTLALAGIVVRAMSRVMTALKNRRQVGSLAQLDDRALKDIGLMRSDVHAALASPFFRDPSVQLIQVAGYKRRIGNTSGRMFSQNSSGQDLNRLRRDVLTVTDRSLVPTLKSLPC